MKQSEAINRLSKPKAPVEKIEKVEKAAANKTTLPKLTPPQGSRVQPAKPPSRQRGDAGVKAAEPETTKLPQVIQKVTKNDIIDFSKKPQSPSQATKVTEQESKKPDEYKIEQKCDLFNSVKSTERVAEVTSPNESG